MLSYLSIILSINLQSNPSKRQRQDVRLDASKILAPRFSPSSDIDKSDWVRVENECSRRTQDEDARDCRAMMVSICRADPQRAAIALSRFLSNKLNADVKAAFEKLIYESTTSSQPVWPVKVASLPCNCPHCIIDSTNDVCVHSPWRKSRMDHMIEAVEDEELTEYSLSTLMKLNVPELRRRLRGEHLTANSNKGDLAKRLAEALAEAANTLHLNTPTLPPTLPNQVAPPSNIN